MHNICDVKYRKEVLYDSSMEGHECTSHMAIVSTQASAESSAYKSNRWLAVLPVIVCAASHDWSFVERSYIEKFYKISVWAFGKHT